jgi:hypothetical protein
MDKPLLNIIGGATLCCYTILDESHIRTGNTTHWIGGDVLETISGLAICQYANDDGFYLFYCDSDWSVFTDTYYDSIDDAKEQAEFEYENSLATWINVL